MANCRLLAIPIIGIFLVEWWNAFWWVCVAFYGVACLGGIGILLRCEVACTGRVVGSVAFGLLCFCLGYAFVFLGWLGLAWVRLVWYGLAWVGLVWLGLAWVRLGRLENLLKLRSCQDSRIGYKLSWFYAFLIGEALFENMCFEMLSFGFCFVEKIIVSGVCC